MIAFFQVICLGFTSFFYLDSLKFLFRRSPNENPWDALKIYEESPRIFEEFPRAMWSIRNIPRSIHEET